MYIISWPLIALIPYFLCWGYSWCLAIIRAYMLEMLPPGARMLSPAVNLQFKTFNYKINAKNYGGTTWCKILDYKQENASVKAFNIYLPNDFPHLLENFMLHKDEDRCNLIGEHVGVCCCCQPFSSQGGHIKTTRQLVEKARMSWNRNS